jgi:hypothetical protein
MEALVELQFNLKRKREIEDNENYVVELQELKQGPRSLLYKKIAEIEFRKQRKSLNSLYFKEAKKIYNKLQHFWETCKDYRRYDVSHYRKLLNKKTSFKYHQYHMFNVYLCNYGVSLITESEIKSFSYYNVFNSSNFICKLPLVEAGLLRRKNEEDEDYYHILLKHKLIKTKNGPDLCKKILSFIF